MKKIISLLLLLSFSIKAQEIKIGTQTWTSKNLNVSTYRNGDKIPQVQDAYAWEKLTTGAWCYYENKTANGTTYGKLYNWFAVNDPRGLAPKGYHIPTDAEWTILTDNLGGGAGKMKSTSGWKDNGNGNNTSGFAGLPGLYRYSFGSFCPRSVQDIGLWWSSSVNADYKPLSLVLYSNDNINRDSRNKREGLSVRCIKN